MKTISFVLAIILVSITHTGYTQESPPPVVNAILQGKVVDSKTEKPLIGVSLQIKGITNGTTSDNNGEFTLYTGQKFPFTLVSSSVGFVTQEIVVKESPVTIKLVEADNKLGDVVVVGYGTRTRKNLVGSVAKIDRTVQKSITE